MRRPTILLMVLLFVFFVAFVRCGGEGGGTGVGGEGGAGGTAGEGGAGGQGGVPSTRIGLFADPEACDVPCEVVLDSGVELSPEEQRAFTWDFGEGPVQGTNRAFHVFQEAGEHRVTLTVSDEQSTTSDAVTVLAEPQPTTFGEIDANGGVVTQGPWTVSVPSGTTDESFPVELTELPSMEFASERTFDEARFQALGDGLEVRLPFKSTTAIGIAVKDAGARGLQPSDLAWLVRTVGRPHPEADVLETGISPAPLPSYALLPVTEVDADGTAHGRIYGSRRLQLVHMAAPLSVEQEPAEAAFAQKSLASPLLVTSFAHPPTKLSRQAYQAAIRDGIRTAHAVFVLGKGYRGPEAVVVSVAKLSSRGSVGRNEHELIEIDRTMEYRDQVRKVVAHEYFHLVQNMHRNSASTLVYFDQDGWFDEGTASWASDEVFDEMEELDDYYHAPSVSRFTRPLVSLTGQAPPKDPYQTVAFWKWAEAKNSGIIKSILNDQFALTHTQSASSKGPIENNHFVDYLTSLKTLWKDVDFLEFVYNARYLKDYDEEEAKWGELWSNEKDGVRLGEQKWILPDESLEIARLPGGASGGWGDSEDNPAEVVFELTPHLTAHVARIENVNLTGELHVRFPVTQATLDARVLLMDAESQDVVDTETVRDLSMGHPDVTLEVDPSQIIVIFVVDPEWDYPTNTGPAQGEILLWVDDEPSFPFITQDEVMLEGELHAGLEFIATNPYPDGGGGPCPAVWAAFQEMDTGHQRTKGRFVDERGRPNGTAINFVQVEKPPDVEMELLMDGTVEETPQSLYWQRGNNLDVDPTTWELRVSYDRTPEVENFTNQGQPYPPTIQELVWPRYLDVWTQIDNQNVKRRVPLVWWRYHGATTSITASKAYEPPPNQSELKCYVDKESEQWNAEFFFGDGDDVGQDGLPMVWSDPMRHHTQVGFIPTGTVGDYSVGPLHSDSIGEACDLWENYLAELFNQTKNTLRLIEQTASASGDDCVEAPALGDPMPNVQFRRDYILSGEQQLFSKHNVQPLEYVITMRAK